MKTYHEIERELIDKDHEMLAKLHGKIGEQQNKLNKVKADMEVEKLELDKVKNEFSSAVIEQNNAIRETFKSELKKEFLPNESNGVANLVFNMANSLTDSNDRVVGYYEDLVVFINDLRLIEQTDKENK